MPSMVYQNGACEHEERVAGAARAAGLAKDKTAIGPLRTALAALLFALAGRLAPATRAPAIAAR